MGLTVKEALTPEDRERIYRLRYQVYVEEMGRKQSFADHENKKIREPYDETAHLFLAEEDGEIIGTIRTNFRQDGPLECEDLYNLERFSPFYPDRISMTTKLMVKHSHRNSVAASYLAVSAYKLMRETGIKLDFIDTNPHLVRLYQQMGYRIYKENINHPDYGNVIPMVFLLDDVEYLKLIGSPFQRYARNYNNTRESWEYFRQHFREYAYIKPLFSIKVDQLWEDFSNDLHKNPREVLTFLKDFSEDECKQLLNQLDLIPYDPGDIVFKQGDESSGMFCILEGQAEALVDSPQGPLPVSILNQGEIFGELGFIAQGERNATIKVRQPSRLLILTPNEFRKLERNSPHLAVKLLINLFSILVKRFLDKSNAYLELRTLLDRMIEKQTMLKEDVPVTESSKGSYTVEEYADGAAEIERLRLQARGGFALEKSIYDRLGFASARRILDAGCGPGFVAMEVANAYQPELLHGVDLSETLIEIALREHRPPESTGLLFQTGSIYDLPLENDFYDLAYSRFVFQHLEKPARALQSMKDKVRPGGTIVIEDIDDGMLFLEPAPDGYERLQENAERIQESLGGNRRIGRELRSLLVSGGLTGVSLKVLSVTSKLIGMKAFIDLAFGFKFDHLKRAGASEQEVEEIRSNFYALTDQPEAYGMLLVFFASGKKPH
ncbi:MAG: GNAT family N-acetyltransferase [Spirochaetales bacterium]|nr:GNAT family N-acetyltransferase [Spirochaetales bacterium]